MSAGILSPGQGLAEYALGGTDGSLKADGDSTGDNFVVCEWTLQPGAFAPSLHRHAESTRPST